MGGLVECVARMIGQVQVAAEGRAGHHERARADQRAGIQHGVAADLGLVPEHGAELLQAGAEGAAGQPHGHFALVEAEVGADDAGPEVRAVAED